MEAINKEEYERKLLRIIDCYGGEDVSDLKQIFSYLEEYPGRNKLDLLLLCACYFFGYGVSRDVEEARIIHSQFRDLNWKVYLKQARSLSRSDIYERIASSLEDDILAPLFVHGRMPSLDVELRRIKSSIEIKINMDEKLRRLSKIEQLHHIYENYGEDGRIYYWNYVTWNFLWKERARKYYKKTIEKQKESCSQSELSYIAEIEASFDKFKEFSLYRQDDWSNGFEWSFISELIDESKEYSFLPSSFQKGSYGFDVVQRGAGKVGELHLHKFKEKTDVFWKCLLPNPLSDVVEIMNAFDEYVEEGKLFYQEPSIRYGEGPIKKITKEMIVQDEDIRVHVEKPSTISSKQT